MSQRYQTKGIILKRVDYAEADRILTLFTPDRGKVSVIAKGVRKPKSKLAGGIELFSVCNIGAIKGRRDIDTLISTRLENHFENIIKDYDCLQLAYDVLRLMDSITDEEAGEEYFYVLESVLELLDDVRMNDSVAMSWFYMQIMKLNGSEPSLLKDIHGNNLEADATYTFSTEDGGFFLSESGVFGADEIKAWRVFLSADVSGLKRVSGLGAPAEKSVAVLKAFAEFQV